MSDISTQNTTISKNVSTSNGRSNMDIFSVISSTNSDANDSDGGHILTTEVKNNNGHDGAETNIKRRDKTHAHRMGTTTHADESQTLNVNDKEHTNDEEYTNDQQELTDNDNTESIDAPRRSKRLAGKSPDANF